MNKKNFVFLILCLFLFLGCAKEEGLQVSKRSGKKARKQKSEQPAAPAPAPVIKKEEPQGRENPFLTKEEEDKAIKNKDVRIPLDNFELSAIIYSPRQKEAVIGGKVFKEGDILDNKVIEKIEAEQVILKDSRGEYVIRLKDLVNKGS
ncbi:MAG: hypothetical protein PHN57_00305 [Candidatus Omnitrophica bacterium]|nr:hypothetical protein [Candidatus Omnitrophota bacterium]